MSKLRASGILCLIVAASAAQPGRTASLSEQVDAINQPRILGKLSVSSIQTGRGTITVGPGTQVYALGDVKGEICGAWVAGSAKFSYQIEDALSQSLAKRNLEVGVGLDVIEEGSFMKLVATLEEAVLWTRAEDLGVPTPAGDPPPFSPWAIEILTEGVIPTPGVEMVAVGGMAPNLSMAWLRGDHADYQLNVDPIESGMESLYWLKRLKAAYGPFKGERAMISQVSQPAGRSWQDPRSRPWIIDRLATNVMNPGGSSLEIEATMAVRALRPGLAGWRTVLPSSVFDNRRNRLPVAVTSVTVDGNAAGFVHLNDDLVVDLGRALPVNERAMIVVTYSGQMALRASNKSYWRLDPGLLFPGTHEDLAGHFQITVDVPEAEVPLASGAELSRESKEGRTRLVARSESIGDFPSLVVGKFHLHEIENRGRSCRVATHVFVQEAAAERIGKLVLAAQEYLEQLFGVAYPYSSLVVVEIDSWGWGQAPDGVIYVTNEAFSPIGTAVLTPGEHSIGVNERVVHEVAHGWWGGTVMSDSENYWITEGLASYLAALAMRVLRGEKSGAKEFKRTVSEWYQVSKRIDDRISLHTMPGLTAWDIPASIDSWRLRYAKGPLVFQAIRERLVGVHGKEEGDRIFVGFLREVLARFQHQFPHTQGLIETLNDVSGEDWQAWFDRFVYGTEVPVPESAS